MITVIEENPESNSIEISNEFLALGKGEIILKGMNNRVHIERPHYIRSFSATLCGEASLSIGHTSTILGMHMAILAPGSVRIGSKFSSNVNCHVNINETANICIGDECLFGPDVTLACSDSHKIIDIETGTRINEPQDIRIGDKIWLAARVSVWKGSKIGNGSIVGFGSFVNSEIPESALVAGTPARVIRHGVRWEQ
jgi:acetyltransferase-like isoleucine patch superfamily enzyme